MRTFAAENFEAWHFRGETLAGVQAQIAAATIAMLRSGAAVVLCQARATVELQNEGQVDG